MAKLGASLILFAASLGLLWHNTQSMGHWGNWGASGPRIAAPPWLNPGLSGWYPQNLNYSYRLFSKSPAAGSIYILSNILCVAAIMVVPFISRHTIRAMLGVPILIAFAYELVVFDVAGSLPDKSITTTMLANFHFGLEGTAWLYSKEILRNTALVVAVAVPFLCSPAYKDHWGILSMAQLAVVFIAATSVSLIFYKTGGATHQFPSPTSTFIYTATFLNNDIERPLKPVEYEHEITPKFEKIILVMDESVRADFLSLNNEDIGTTPYLTSVRSKIVNFGTAASAANCSIESRLAIRYMVRQFELGQPWPELLTNTTIWQYARKAGYRTVYIDSFGGALTLTSGMTATERSHIDERISVVDKPFHDRDPKSSLLLRDLLRQDGPLFIFVDKYGTHVPYTNAYPIEQNAFDADITKAFDLDNREELERHYKNAVRWSVDEFFRNLGVELPPSTLLIYTSDHGQTLSAGGKMSHCSSSGELQAAEVQVPLFAISMERGWKQALAEAARLRLNRTSHLHIAPTLLLAMGYDAGYVKMMFDTPPLNVAIEPRGRRVLFGGRSIEID